MIGVTGIQRHKGNHLWGIDNKIVRRSPAHSGLPSDGLEDRGKSEHNTLFTGFPSKLENDGIQRLVYKEPSASGI